MIQRSTPKESTAGRLLIVEDDDQIRTLLAYLLGQSGYAVFTATTGEEALARRAECNPDLVLLDVHLPGRSGHDVLREIRASEDGRLLPVVMMTGWVSRQEKLDALAAGVTDFIVKPFDPEEMVARVRSLVSFKSLTDVLEEATKVVIALAKTIDARDPYTAGHSERVSFFAGLLAERIGLSASDARVVREGGLFHDIGKIALPDPILLKPGPLTPTEFEQIKRHPVVGRDLIAHLKTLAPALPIVLHHHERLDGSGYPNGLMGDSIPLFARVTSVADIYDSMTTVRPYRRALSQDEALSIMHTEARRGWWDEELVDEFCVVMSVMKEAHTG
jgi:cyclic di-GMP phosphodiesterase